MPSDISSRLEGASAGPSSSPNMNEIWQSAGRRTRVARVGALVGVVMAVGIPLGAYALITGNSQRGTTPSDGRQQQLHGEICQYGKDLDCVPFSTEFARYAVTVRAAGSDIADKGSPSDAGVVNGVVEIVPPDRSACLTLTGLSFSEASITDGVTTVVFPRDEERQDSICVDASVTDLGAIVGEPDRFRLEVRLSSGETTTAPLRYMDQSGSPEGDLSEEECVSGFQLCASEGAITVDILKERCRPSGECTTTAFKKQDRFYLEFIDQDKTSPERCGPGDCGAVPSALRMGWNPGQWKVVPPDLESFRRPEPATIDLQAGEEINIGFIYREME